MSVITPLISEQDTEFNVKLFMLEKIPSRRRRERLQGHKMSRYFHNRKSAFLAKSGERKTPNSKVPNVKLLTHLISRKLEEIN